MPVTSGMPTDCNGGMVSSGCCGSEMSTVVPAPAREYPHQHRIMRRVLLQCYAATGRIAAFATARTLAEARIATPADTRPTLKPADVPPPPAAESLAPTGTSGPAVNQPPMSSLPWNQAAPANRAPPVATMPKPGRPWGRRSWLPRVCDRIRYRVRTLLPRFPRTEQ